MLSKVFASIILWPLVLSLSERWESEAVTAQGLGGPGEGSGLCSTCLPLGLSQQVPYKPPLSWLEGTNTPSDYQKEPFLFVYEILKYIPNTVTVGVQAGLTDMSRNMRTHPPQLSPIVGVPERLEDLLRVLRKGVIYNQNELGKCLFCKSEVQQQMWGLEGLDGGPAWGLGVGRGVLCQLLEAIY